jgi:hypothetical protein
MKISSEEAILNLSKWSELRMPVRAQLSLPPYLSMSLNCRIESVGPDGLSLKSDVVRWKGADLPRNEFTYGMQNCSWEFMDCSSFLDLKSLAGEPLARDVQAIGAIFPKGGSLVLLLLAPLSE